MALNIYLRASDYRALVRDRFLEVSDLMYIPVADSLEDLGIGAGDTGKPGAVAAYMDGAVCKLAVYNGDGTWSPVGGDSGPTYTPNNTLDPFSTTSAALDSAYPDSKTGDMVANEDADTLWTKLESGKWTRTSLDIV